MFELFVLDIYEQLSAGGIAIIALVLGALIGYEREIKRRSAGLTTHALVALACCLFTESALFFFDFYVDRYPLESLRIDPAAIIQGVIVAMGFIAAGAIIKNPDIAKVENLTTACTILCAGVVGVSVGIHLIPLAIISTVLVLGVNILGAHFEQKFIHADKEAE